MMVKLKQELSENNTARIHITTTLRHLDNFPQETEGARFLSIFPTTVGKPHDIKHLVTHCSKFFQMLAEVFSDISNVNVTHYVMSNIGCVDPLMWLYTSCISKILESSTISSSRNALSIVIENSMTLNIARYFRLFLPWEISLDKHLRFLFFSPNYHRHNRLDRLEESDLDPSTFHKPYTEPTH